MTRHADGPAFGPGPDGGWFNDVMTQAGASGATIRLFLVDGTPQGIRVVDRSQWTGVCLAFSRADYTRARLRDEFTRDPDHR
ncbi:hypothetical protein Aglo03_50170 [Actinokineospora globicatena]|uniref:Uncharacterized protein n=1 Tax=Actinokineospora globicatena TaxID=103729 RepID=A0A9W6QNN9_9PSEU|nr:hypothetical protein Aglo03_50170 [Actinokineospora globicatena]